MVYNILGMQHWAEKIYSFVFMNAMNIKCVNMKMSFVYVNTK